MKNLFTWILLIMPIVNGFAQEIAPAPADKAVVYFVRTSAFGAIINFSYFDGNKLIGRFNAPKYIRYECEPGEHVFWARSENKDFVKANLSAGKIYFINAIPELGGVKARVKLMPVNPQTYNMKRMLKLLKKRDSESFTQEELNKIEQELSTVITTGMKRYETILAKGAKIDMLTPDMNYE